MLKRRWLNVGSSPSFIFGVHNLSPLVRLLHFCHHRVPAQRPRSEEELLDSTFPKLKSVLSGIRGRGLGVFFLFALIVGQDVIFYASE